MKYKVTLPVAAAMFAFAPPTIAEDRVIEEVVVTGERREQNINEVSGSIGVVTNEDIMQLGIDDFMGFSRSQPGVAMHQPVKNRSTFNVRGINTDIGDTQLTQEPVTVYINDMPVSQPYASLVQVDLRLYDIDRIEILRGPQGTLFGSGSLGGLVRVITTEPHFGEFEASTRIDAADVDQAGLRTRLDGMVNVPLGDNLALRAVAYTRGEPGWVKNINLGTENSSDDYGGRLSLRWAPTDQFDAKVEYLYQNSDPEDGDAWNPALGQFRRDTVVTEQRKSEFSQLNFTLAYEIDDFASLLSSTNFQETKSNWRLQSGEIPGVGKLLNLTDPYNTDYFVQEVRLVSNRDSALSWIAGVFYSDIETTDASFRFVLDGLRAFVDATAGPGIVTSDDFLTAPFQNTSRELAFYGDVTYQISDAWKVSSGFRWFEFESHYTDGGSYAFDFATLSPLNLPRFTNRAEDSDVTWRTILSWEPGLDQLYYVSLSRGYRVGQVNPNFGPSFVDPTDVVIDPSYGPDESINYELGAKITGLAGRLQLNAAMYRIEWQDIQVDALRPSDQRNYIANAGDAISSGLELEVFFVAREDLDLRVTASWQDAEIESISASNTFLSGAREGDSLPGTPDFLASAQLNYDWSLGGQSMLSWFAAQYVGESTNRFGLQPATGLPNPDLAINASYTNIDAGVTLMGNQWDLTLYIENATNNDNIILDTGAIATASGENHYITLRPRTIGLRLDWYVN